MSRAPFMAGVRQFAQMIEEAKRLRAGPWADDSAIAAEYRRGPQTNIVEPHLRRLLEEPGKLEGFAAALSDYLAMDESTEPFYYSEITEGEIFGETHEGAAGG